MNEAGKQNILKTEDYADAHFEKAEETTIPPRYYAPPERTQRERREKDLHSGHSFPFLLFIILLVAFLGGLLGSVITSAQLSKKIDALEKAVISHEKDRLEAQAATDAALGALSDVSKPEEENAGYLLPSEIYDLAKKQVVGVRSEVTVTNFFGMRSSGAVSGSGFIISDDGYVLTNYHVVENAYQNGLNVQVVLYDGKEYNAVISGAEPFNDIAVLKIDAEGLSPATLGDSDQLLVGDSIYAIGNPLGELEFSMSTGHVSALDRVISTQESESINMFQIDAAVNEGNSGGPVYNRKGEVIGIVTAKYSSSGVEGLGFAIPSNDAQKIADDLINKGYVTGKALIGVSLDNRYNSMYSQYYGMPLGAYVAEVFENSAAEAAGLQTGDIITAIGEYRIQDYTELKTVLRNFSAFESTVITVYRSGEELQLPITFDEVKPD